MTFIPYLTLQIYLKKTYVSKVSKGLIGGTDMERDEER